NELKEKVSANFDTKKADAILATAGAGEATQTQVDQPAISKEQSNHQITEQTNVLVLCEAKKAISSPLLETSIVGA
ncbi:hypothetical protein, partial [Lentilactobacillus parakefiri]|uniref:hypothetical protein n=1 Tax=Lentilactobacillus parakefiri TaxID=152332 RepID=UPI00117A67BF